MKAHRNEVDAIVTSATTLSNAQVRQISEALAAHTEGKKVKLEAIVDESILGGLKVQIGDKFLDLSAATKIASVKRSI